jgi:hypothetical protein
MNKFSPATSGVSGVPGLTLSPDEEQPTNKSKQEQKETILRTILHQDLP